MRRLLAFTLACIVGFAYWHSSPTRAAIQDPRMVHLAVSHIPAAAAHATLLGRMASAAAMTVDFVLPLRNQAQLTDELNRVSDPSDPMYGHYLTAQQFADEYGPSLADVSAVAAFAKSKGLGLVSVSGNRTLIQVSGSSSVVERAFGVHLTNYRSAEGRIFFAPDREPLFPTDIANRLIGVAGLDNAMVIRLGIHQTPQVTRHELPAFAQPLLAAQPQAFYSSGFDGLSPDDIRSVYNLPSLAAPGAGQTLGLFELDGYTASDVAFYNNYYDPGLSQVPLQNVLVDGFSGQPQTTEGAIEVTLDIELMIALCPDADKIIVYEASSGGTGLVDEYAKIASDDLASVVSSSWAGTEDGTTPLPDAVSENLSFQQMARQGQSMFAGSGDSGAYANEIAADASQGIAGTYGTLSVDDPGSQPYVTSIGGTQLNDTSSESYLSESAWGDPSDTSRGLSGTGSGGGISAWWPIPSYQSGFANAGNLGSPLQRSVPDVSLLAGGQGGYSYYYQGAFSGANGTSAAAPLWAAYTALVNQGRAANHLAKVGFLNPAIYSLAKNAAAYAADFHDIADGSTNLYYPAVPGYDLATGLGTPQGAALYHDLVTPPAVPKTWTAVGPGAGQNGTSCLLWDRSDGAAGVWTLGAAGTVSVVGPTYGPYSGWTAKSVAMASDSTSRMLWTNADGQAGVWSFNAAGVETIIGPTYGPFSGWAARAVAVAGDGTSRVLWANTNGQAGIWSLGTNDALSAVGPTYGPNAGWTAKSLATASSGVSQVLWTNTNGQAGVWSFNVGDVNTVIGPTYGPYPGWTAKAVGAAADGTARVLWTNTNGEAGLWSFSASDVNTAIGAIYGPYPGWNAGALATAGDGTSRVLWTNSNRSAGVWSFGANDSESVIGTVYGPF